MPSLNCILVSCFLTITSAIRVDWNTNKGPIIPPTPTTTHRPLPPYREPAAVWENISNDIPNPNPYIYVQPPPSRPKQRLHTKVDYNQDGVVIQPYKYPYDSANNGKATIIVSSLSPQYIPNVGHKYAAVVPKVYSSKYDDDDKVSSLYKWQGKYNAKAKKYKAYEKVKYKPQNYSAKFQRDSGVKAGHDENNFNGNKISTDLPQQNTKWLKLIEQQQQQQQQQLSYETRKIEHKSEKLANDSSTESPTTESTAATITKTTTEEIKRFHKKVAYYKDVTLSKSKKHLNKTKWNIK